jgi:hypothetical protein
MEDEDPSSHDAVGRDYLRLFRDMGVAEIGFGLPTIVGRDYAALPRPQGFRYPDLFRRLFAFHYGVAGPCSGDWERRLIAGDASISSIKDIRGMPACQAPGGAHLGGCHRDPSACRSCSVPWLSGVGARAPGEGPVGRPGPPHNG